MDPFSGYQLRLSQATSFTYNEGDDGVASQGSDYIYSKQTDVFDLNIHDYEYNGSATIEIILDGNKIQTNSIYLGAFDNGECVGKVVPIEFPLTGDYIFPLMMYSNNINSELSLKLYNSITNEYIDISQICYCVCL